MSIKVTPLEISLSTNNGRTIPRIILSVYGSKIIFVGYKAGSSIRGLETNVKLFHWGYDDKTKSYAEVEYGSSFMNKDTAKEYCTAVLEVVCSLLDSSEYTDLVSKYKDDMVHKISGRTVSDITITTDKTRSIFSRLLGCLSDHFKCDMEPSSGGYYSARIASLNNRNQNSNANTFSPDLTGVFG
jgi:hypothetical protein